VNIRYGLQTNVKFVHRMSTSTCSYIFFLLFELLVSFIVVDFFLSCICYFRFINIDLVIYLFIFYTSVMNSYLNNFLFFLLYYN